MRKIVICISFILIWSMLLNGCRSKAETIDTDMEWIQGSQVVKLETSDGDVMIVWTTLMQSFAALRIQPTSGEAITEEDAWIYRFTYNPSEKVINGHETVVTFYNSYIKVGDVFYVPEEDLPYSSILEWASGKVNYFKENYD